MATTAKIAKEDKAPKYKIRLRNRCHRCGRPRAYMRKFALCRLCFRKLALEGDIAPIECITADADGLLVCSREHHQNHEPCPTKFLWTRVQGSIVRTLNEMTLDDLVQPLTQKKKAKATA